MNDSFELIAPYKETSIGVMVYAGMPDPFAFALDGTHWRKICER